MDFFRDIRRLNGDVLIIGGGGTGLAAAITAKAMGADVIVASKARVGYANNTYIAGGMISSPGQGDTNDSPDEGSLGKGRYHKNP